MTLQSDHPIVQNASAPLTYKAPRGGSYVTLPAGRHGSPRTEGTYVSLPAGGSGNGNKVQGSYVTLHAAQLEETEISYTRRG